MDSNEEPWVQVIGSLAVHTPDRATVELTGSTRTMLAILVAAGPDGAWIEEIAQAYWSDERPAWWHVALRSAFRTLETRLPDGWQIDSSDSLVRLVPGSGWVDAWRAEELLPAPQTPPWLSSGQPFPGIEGIPLVDRAVLRLGTLFTSRIGGTIPAAGESDIFDRQRDSIRAAHRAIVLGPAEERTRLVQAIVADRQGLTRVVGDRRLALAFGPYVVAFPELRDKLAIEPESVDPETVTEAHRIVGGALAQRAENGPHRLVVPFAHELDEASLLLTLRLLELGPSTNLSIVLGADEHATDPKWLDFMGRAQTAGCHVLRLSAGTYDSASAT